MAFLPVSEEEGLTLDELAYRRLSRALVTGAMLPGDRLSIRGVAAALGVSSMPARTALQRLAAEQAVDLLPSGTAVVPRLTRAGFAELSAIRAELEPLAVRLAAPHLTEADWTRLAALISAHDTARGAGEAEAIQAADRDFLFLIYRAAQAPLLLGLIETLWLRRGPLFGAIRGLSGALGGMRHRHGEILASLRERAGEPAAALLRSEIEEATRFIQSTLRFEDDDTAAERLAAIGQLNAHPLDREPTSLSHHRRRRSRGT
ncbi:GntR family transcriptional regulator [Roseomonas terrae]|uniref:GntR family transcriptional regulator n=1 Tax=Neoroseomonas terrae TaxID=424799 RepID=A0ABS5EBI9_9PROT|nr:GntR family transcriptional regulator [Neoroseomonas terrae]MBR0648377.1 GntR family transcriptional regulator [Neoroseomonas terrae]